MALQYGRCAGGSTHCGEVTRQREDAGVRICGRCGDFPDEGRSDDCGVGVAHHRLNLLTRGDPEAGENTGAAVGQTLDEGAVLLTDLGPAIR
jgi:hypothetical protein